MDPYSILGLSPGASDAEIAAAYRRLAKEWHPDIHGTEAAMRRMVAINAAYEALRGRGGDPAKATPEPPAAPPARPRPPLPRELLAALRPDEDVVAHGRTATWDSPEAFLVLTSDRLLWLLDDAVTHRVRSLARSQVATVDVEQRRRRATLHVASRRGRRFAFADLAPATAQAVAASLSATASSGR